MICHECSAFLAPAEASRTFEVLFSETDGYCIYDHGNDHIQTLPGFTADDVVAMVDALNRRAPAEAPELQDAIDTVRVAFTHGQLTVGEFNEANTAFEKILARVRGLEEGDQCVALRNFWIATRENPSWRFTATTVGTSWCASPVVTAIIAQPFSRTYRQWSCGTT